MGIPLLLGRDISASDTAAAPTVVVVNETIVKKYLGGANPVGRTFVMNERNVQIVGTCRDAKYESVRDAIPPVAYISYLQHRMQGSMTFSVRTEGAPLTVAPLVRSAVSAIDPQLPISDLRTQQDQIEQTIGPERFFAGFASAFGMTAVLLAALGLYGVLAYGVARRTPEIGIRVALGAERGDVLWLVLRESLVMVAAGLAIGLPSALAITRLARAAVYGIEPGDPLSFVAGTVALLAVARRCGLASCAPRGEDRSIDRSAARVSFIASPAHVAIWIAASNPAVTGRACIDGIGISQSPAGQSLCENRPSHPAIIGGAPRASVFMAIEEPRQ